ncbi:hypothetical protein SUDANB145_07099 [Streptomyces sp. enrichment culture]
MEPPPESRTGDPVDNRSDIRGFLTSRRAKVTPERVGLPTGRRRRVPGLRREEVAAPTFVRTGRLDIVASNALCRALYAPMFDSATTGERGCPNFPRYFFLDPGSRDFFVDWEEGARATVAVLRAEAGRAPHDRALRELVGELSTLSPDFRTTSTAVRSNPGHARPDRAGGTAPCPTAGR